MNRFAISGFFAVGSVCVVRGVWMIYPHAAFLVCGMLLVALAIGFVLVPEPVDVKGKG